VVELEELRLCGTSLTSEQCEALFLALNEGDKWLERLHISYCNLATIDPAHLAKVLSSLQEVAVMYSSLTPLQLRTLFLCIIQGSTLLKVDLSYNDLSSVDPDLLAEAINKLESVTMNRTCVTSDQVTNILVQSLETTSLTELNIAWRKAGVSEEIVFEAAQKYAIKDQSTNMVGL